MAGLNLPSAVTHKMPWTIQQATLETLRTLPGPSAMDFMMDLDAFLEHMKHVCQQKHDGPLYVHCPELLSINQQYALARMLLACKAHVVLLCFEPEALCNLLLGTA